MPLKKTPQQCLLYTLPQNTFSHSRMQFSLSQFPVEHQTYVRSCDGAKSLRALLAALKVKSKKAHLLYFEKCHAFIKYCFFFNFLLHTVQNVQQKERKNEKKHGKDNCGQTRGYYRNGQKRKT
jgi:hypothetical protein